MDLKINVIAVLTAVAVNFVIGFSWYGALFAKAWGKEMGYDPNMRPDRNTMLKGMALMIVGNFLFALVLAFYLAGWQYIPGAKEMSPFSTGINSAISVWIGFYVPVHLGRIVWEKHSWKLFSINSGYHLVATAVVALILTYWRA